MDAVPVAPGGGRLLALGLLGEQLDERDRGVIAAPRAELHDPRVATRSIREPLGDVEQHLLDEVDLGRRAALLDARAEARDVGGDVARRSEALRAVAARELLHGRVGRGADAPRLGDEALGDPPELLGLGVGGLDPLVQDEIRRQVAQHRATAAGVAIELPTGVPVAHGFLVLVLLLLLLPALEHLRPVVDLHAQGEPTCWRGSP